MGKIKMFYGVKLASHINSSEQTGGTWQQGVPGNRVLRIKLYLDFEGGSRILKLTL
jgi:hypothetical protein